MFLLRNFLSVNLNKRKLNKIKFVVNLFKFIVNLFEFIVNLFLIECTEILINPIEHTSKFH